MSKSIWLMVHLHLRQKNTLAILRQRKERKLHIKVSIMSSDLSLHDCKSALIDLLNALQSANSNSAHLERVRNEAGNDMIKHMQIVFPVLTQIQVSNWSQ